ncbi:beta-phosphoglucomutase [Salipaludibacillus daqingensis]|uniref:beta-phosphoglucomutase n=1 Tax=Salipaludibacillus daqingensis TaxID=3041001 RepID=UPI002475EA9E|nr:beta-phosphoglucomutase [Salipaludibacillus daqingensis]
MKAVIFDLDGVLANTVEFHYLSTKKVADVLNVPFTREMNQQFQGMNRNHLIKHLLKHTEKPFSDKDIKTYGTLKNKTYQNLIQTLKPEDVLPGMMTFLLDLKNQNIQTAIASSSSNAKTVLEKLEIVSFFDTIVPAASITKMKPDPEIFLRAADDLHVPYNECVAIEDSEAGMQAIQATTMFSVGIGSDPLVKTADWHVYKTEDLTLTTLIEKFECKNNKR